MPKIAVISANPSAKSAKELADALKATYFNLADTSKSRYHEFDIVFNYGTSFRPIHCKQVINTPKAVSTCINKIATLKKLKEAGVPCVEFTLDKEVARKWPTVAVRATATGKAGDGLDWWKKSSRTPLPAAAFYSKHYPHWYEYRVVVYKDEVAARYVKNEVEGGMMHLHYLPSKGFKTIEKACISAASALGIDYVGFDVLAVSKTEFVILEANSGPIITEEIINFLKEKLK